MNNKLSYFVSKSQMFGLGFLLLFKYNGKNAYLTILLGSLLGLVIIFIYSKIKNNINNLKYNNIYILLLIVFCLYIITNILIIICFFVNSFYLIHTPPIFIILPFLLLSFYISFKDKETLFNISKLSFYFSITNVLLFGLLLIKYIDFSNIYPIFNYNNYNIIKCSIIYASITAIPQILVISYENNFKNIYKNYLIASTINMLIIMCIILCLKESLIKIYNFPEYVNLKQVKLFDFIENIENISAFGWYSESFIMLSLTINNLKTYLLDTKKTILILLISILISITIIKSYKLIIISYNIYPIILIIFFILFIIIFLIIKKEPIGS